MRTEEELARLAAFLRGSDTLTAAIAVEQVRVDAIEDHLPLDIEVPGAAGGRRCA